MSLGCPRAWRGHCVWSTGKAGWGMAGIGKRFAFNSCFQQRRQCPPAAPRRLDEGYQWAARQGLGERSGLARGCKLYWELSWGWLDLLVSPEPATLNCKTVRWRKWLSGCFHFHETSFSIPLLSVYVCLLIWSESLVGSIYKGLGFFNPFRRPVFWLEHLIHLHLK